MNWKTWTVLALLIVVVFAIYSWASDGTPSEPAQPAAGATLDPEGEGAPASDGTPAASRGGRRPATAPPGVTPVRLDLLEAESGSFRSDRNIFAYVEPPPPPPPPPPAPPPPPPDQDQDGVPDFRDNCVAVANPDQRDIDGDGIGSACETEPEVPPPPPPPVPPAFSWKFIGMFGPANNPIATFARDGEIVNARVGEIIEGKFILRHIGIESVEIGFVGFPADQRQRIPIGAQ